MEIISQLHSSSKDSPGPTTSLPQALHMKRDLLNWIVTAAVYVSRGAQKHLSGPDNSEPFWLACIRDFRSGLPPKAMVPVSSSFLLPYPSQNSSLRLPCNFKPHLIELTLFGGVLGFKTNYYKIQIEFCCPTSPTPAQTQGWIAVTLWGLSINTGLKHSRVYKKKPESIISCASYLVI